jgi:hypothetical protein
MSDLNCNSIDKITFNLDEKHNTYTSLTTDCSIEEKSFNLVVNKFISTHTNNNTQNNIYNNTHNVVINNNVNNKDKLLYKKLFNTITRNMFNNTFPKYIDIMDNLTNIELYNFLLKTKSPSSDYRKSLLHYAARLSILDFFNYINDRLTNEQIMTLMDMKTNDGRTVFIQACGQIISIPPNDNLPRDFIMVKVFLYVLENSSPETIQTTYRANSSCYNGLGMFEFRHLETFSTYIHLILQKIFPKGGKC